MRLKKGFQRVAQENRAVSPVIGVILMVAITVILAAVIGAFVLEIGDQQETAPSTSFDSEQSTQFFDLNRAPWRNERTRNETAVRVTHAGGEKVGLRNYDIKVNGNATAWQIENEEMNDGDIYSEGNKWLADASPQPDFRVTAGTNEQFHMSSGESNRVVTYGGADKEKFVHDGCTIDAQEKDNDDGDPLTMWGHNGCSFFSTTEPLDTEDKIYFVWTASSGGKTQTLFKYTVQ